MNETPWKLFGYEKFISESGDACVRLYVARPLVLSHEGNTGEGIETQRLFYKEKYVKYNPVLNHLIVATPGRFPGSISQIFVVGQDSND